MAETADPTRLFNEKGGPIVENASNTYSGTSGGNDSGNLVTEQVRQGAQQAVQSTQQVAGQVVDKAKEQAQSMVDQRKGQATGTLRTVSRALQQAGDNLRQQEQGPAAGLIDTAASRVEGMATYLESRDLPELIGEAERFARRNSALFLGGAFALGVLAARFLKSSSPPPQYSSNYSGGGYSGYRGYDSYTAYQPSGGATGYYPAANDYPGTGFNTPGSYNGPSSYGQYEAVSDVYSAQTPSTGYTGGTQTPSTGFMSGTTDLETDLESSTGVTDVPTDGSY